MSYANVDIQKQIENLESSIREQKRRLVELRKMVPEQAVENYVFETSGGESVSLADLFVDHDELIVIHNMGKRCSYCTMWADGFNGVVRHLEKRAGFVVSSPDDAETQRELAAARGWMFNMVSTKGTSFTRDMGFEPEPRKYWPGVTVFRKDDEGKIYRGAQTHFGPGDDYCSVWHLFDLLPKGVNGWEPEPNS